MSTSRAAVPLCGLIAFMLLVLVVGAPLAQAQEDSACNLTNAPVFAGHNFGEGNSGPAPSEPGDFDFTDGYPNLSTDFRFALQVTHAGDGSDRIFVVQQGGQIYSFDNRQTSQSADLFLNLAAEIVTGSERGLLGLAFDPDFGTPGSPRFGEFYVYTSVAAFNCQCAANGSCELPSGSRDHCSNVIRYRANATGGSSVPNSVVLSSKEIVLEIEQPASFHNGGGLAFGPDGFLYIATGDGGSGSTPSTPQDTSSLLGKILRINPRGPSTYVIPPSNPFFGSSTQAPEVLHYGLRNPFRISFDRQNGDLWISDVGQTRWEEINLAPNGTTAAMNFGWPNCEGTHQPGTSNSCGFSHDGPVIEIPRPNSGGSIVGGYVYRGSRFPSLVGQYIFSEQLSRRFWRWDRQTTNPSTGLAELEVLGDFERVVSLGEDESGEILMPDFRSTTTGRIRVLEEIPGTGGGGNTGGGGTSEGIPLLLSDTGLFNNLGAGSLNPVPGMVEYSVGSPLWSDGALKRRWFALPAGEEIEFSSKGAWEFPLGTVLVKQFDLPHANLGQRRVETRVMLREADDWLAFTYRWNAAQTNATLLSEGAVEDICLDNGCSTEQTWNYPSPVECLACHTEISGRVLGLNTAQLNHAQGGENQLRTLNCQERFDTNIGVPTQYRSLAGISAGNASIHHRVRSYLQANCAHCHQPGSGVPGGIDFRLQTPLSQAGVIGETPIVSIPGLTDQKLLKVGDPANSVIWRRQSSSDLSIRMAKNTLERDAAATGTQFSWILNSIQAAPDDDTDNVTDDVDNCPTVYNPSQDNYDNDGDGDLCDSDTTPDLEADAALGTNFDYQLSPGETVEVVGLVTNTGSGPAAASQARFFLTEDLSFQAELDPIVGECFVEPLAPGALGFCVVDELSVPQSVVDQAGNGNVSRYVGICADGLELIDESNETNGCSVIPIPIQVPEPDAKSTWLAVGLGLLGLVGLSRPSSTDIDMPSTCHRTAGSPSR